MLDIALILLELNNYGSTLEGIRLILTKLQIIFMHFDHLFVSKQIAIAHRCKNNKLAFGQTLFAAATDPIEHISEEKFLLQIFAKMETL